MVREHNPYVHIYRSAHEHLLEQEAQLQNVAPHSISVRLHFLPGTDKHQYNMPTGDDVAAVIVNLPEGVADHHDVVVHLHTPDNLRNHLQWIHDCSPVYDPLHYVLLFPMGDHGWHWDMGLKSHDQVIQDGPHFQNGQEVPNHPHALAAAEHQDVAAEGAEGVNFEDELHSANSGSDAGDDDEPADNATRNRQLTLWQYYAY